MFGKNKKKIEKLEKRISELESAIGEAKTEAILVNSAINCTMEEIKKLKAKLNLKVSKGDLVSEIQIENDKLYLDAKKISFAEGAYLPKHERGGN